MTAYLLLTPSNETKICQIKKPFVYKEMSMVFALLVICFAAWEVTANMTKSI